MEHEDLHDVLDSELDLEEDEKEESMVEDEDNTDMDSKIESDVEDVENSDLSQEKPKGEDIYVENDISNLERMLGISSTDSDLDDEDSDSEEEDIDEEEDTYSDLEDGDNSETTELDDSEPEEKEEQIYEEPEEKETSVKPVEGVMDDKKELKIKNPVLLSDFMDRADSDSFTFLKREPGGYSLMTMGLDNKKEIQKAVRSPNYIFRYPRFVLRDPVLGFVEDKQDNLIHYTVYFPEYSLSFTVSSDYQKPYSQSFKEYFEDLVTRIRPMGLAKYNYKDSVIITSLKILETGLLELETTMGTEKYLLNDNGISFYAVLDYIRTVSDQGADRIKLSLIPEFFVRI